MTGAMITVVTQLPAFQALLHDSQKCAAVLRSVTLMRLPTPHAERARYPAFVCSPNSFDKRRTTSHMRRILMLWLVMLSSDGTKVVSVAFLRFPVGGHMISTPPAQIQAFYQ